ncbi:hypothetical protein ACFLXI_05355 [Chloroflexota bacterium]
MKKFPIKYLIFTVLLLASLSLNACNSVTTVNPPEDVQDISEDPQTEVMLPVVESGIEENDETTADEKAYPTVEEETQNSDLAEINQDEPYPIPEIETPAQDDPVIEKEETSPTPQEEPLQELAPTPRGNELVATNPVRVKLASGQPQLVELFAFW